MSEGEDPRRLPGGGAAPVPPEPVQVQWPQTVAVIFNPSSGGDTASERGDRIRQAIEDTGKKLIWLETTPADSGQRLAKDAVGQGADLVIATGGDGTVMACATALAGSQVPLAVLPLGTGNLVATNFDIPNDLDQALEIALACQRRSIDVGAIDDGQFDIAVLKTRTVGDWVGVATRILVRSRKSGPDVDTFRAAKLEIRCDRAQPVQFDGDTPSSRPTGSLWRSTPPPSPWPSPNTTRTRPPQSGKTPTEHRHRRTGNPPAGRGRDACQPAFDLAEEQARGACPWNLLCIVSALQRPRDSDEHCEVGHGSNSGAS